LDNAFQTPSRPDGANQRSEDRTATVLRPVFVENQEFAGFCLVRNLSSQGMMGEVYTSFVSHCGIAVHFSSDRVVRGRVIWCKEGRIGVQFDDPVNVAEVLSDLATRVIEGRVIRAPRVQVQCTGTLVIGDRSLAIELQDISQRGAKVAASFIVPGDEVYLQLRGLHARKALVCWTLRGHAGLKFVMPVPFEELALWIIGQVRSQHDHGKSPQSVDGRATIG
jgi:hypothetical protein